MKTLIIGEYPTAEEARKNKPFSGPGGLSLQSMLTYAGIKPKDRTFVNLVNTPPLHNEMTQFCIKTKEAKEKKLTPTKGIFPKEELKNGLEFFKQHLAQNRYDLIIAAGSWAMWAVTEDQFDIGNDSGFKVPKGIGKYRGSMLRLDDGTPLLPIYNQQDMSKVRPWYYKTVHDITARVKLLIDNRWDDPERNFLIRPSFEQVMSSLSFLLYQAEKYGSQKVACDIETKGHSIVCIGFAHSVNDAFCIPFTNLNAEDKHYWSEEEEAAIIFKMQQVFTDPRIKLVGQNFVFDAQYINFYWHVQPHIYEDTMLMQHLVYPGTELDLNTLSSMYCEFHRYWKDDGKEWLKNMDEERLWTYNCRDCVVTFEASEPLEQLITYHDLDLQWSWQQRQINEILDMMIRGIRIDPERKHMARHELDLRIEQYQERLEQLLPEDVYPRKPKASAYYSSVPQLNDIFHNYFGQKPYWNRKKKTYTMDDSALEYYADREPVLAELCNTLREYRSLSTFKTFTHMPTSPDGRMRSSYTPTAETFRWKSSENVFGDGGNLQNLPKGNEE